MVDRELDRDGDRAADRAKHREADRSPSPRESGALCDSLMSGQAWRDYCDRLKAVGERILGDGFPTSARDRAEGFRHLTRLISYASSMEIEAGDPLHPAFVRYETPHSQWGGPNPDNLYLRANIDPAQTYRVWADVRGMRQAIFSLNEGDMQLQQLGVFSECTLADLEVRDDGVLELWISPDEQSRNWMRSHPKGRLLTIRVYQSDWDADAGPVFHIERVGAEGVPRPPIEPADVARGLERAARWGEASAVFWNQYTRAGWQRATPNHVAAARATPGGADNILYGSCFFELTRDRALILACEVPDADYWSFTLHTLAWLESGAFADRQTSLSGHQAHVDADARVRVVLAHEDPGVPNWIDIEGRERGLLVYRWVWSRNNPVPEARVVKLTEVRGQLPDDHPKINRDERRAMLARRRASAWKRFQ